MRSVGPLGELRLGSVNIWLAQLEDWDVIEVSLGRLITPVVGPGVPEVVELGPGRRCWSVRFEPPRLLTSMAVVFLPPGGATFIASMALYLDGTVVFAESAQRRFRWYGVAFDTELAVRPDRLHLDVRLAPERIPESRSI